MSYSPEVFVKVAGIYEERRRAAVEGLEARSAEAQRKIPELVGIEEKLHATGLRIMQAINTVGNVEGVRRENERLVARRAELLRANGFPPDYCDPRYVCPRCQDTGYADQRRCACMQDALYRAQAELSGLGKLLGRQTFDNFSLDYYTDRAAARRTLDVSRDFAANGWKNGRNLLLMGGTGLGKTHLSTAIADAAMRGGAGVIYESAPAIIEQYRAEQFGRGYGDRAPSRTEKYPSVDLLIIDDLGCETPGAFAVSTVYTLINARLLAGRATLINTNLSPNELNAAYDRRITSRILGNYTVCLLEGTDVRLQKLKEGKK